MTAIHHERSVPVSHRERGGAMLLLAGDDLRARRIAGWLHANPNLQLDLVRCRELAEAVEAPAAELSVALVDLTDQPPNSCLPAIRLLSDRLRCPIVVIVDLDGPSPVSLIRAGAEDCVVFHEELSIDEIDHTVRTAVARRQAVVRRPGGGPGCSQSCDENCPDCGGFDDFARVLAHDLRAPVRTARLHANYLVSSLPELADELDRFSSRLEGTLEHLEEMIVSILDYATLATLDLPPDTVRLAEAVHGAIDIEAADLGEIGASVVVDIDDDIVVVAQSTQLERVASNLLGNAVAHASPGVDLVVTIRAVRDHGRVRLFVADNGVGVPASEAERVFQPLRRLRPGTDGGLGLGLSICRRIVDGFGGSIHIVPDDGPGTEVVIELLDATGG